MDQEIYILNGDRMLRNFIEDASITLLEVEKKLSLESAQDPLRVKKLGEQYRVSHLLYKDEKVDVDIKPKDHKIKGFEQAYKEINEEVEAIGIYAVGRISNIRGVLGKLVAFEDKERKSFGEKFHTDKRDYLKILEEAIEDFEQRFTRRFNNLTLNGDPLVPVVKKAIEEEVIERKSIIISQMQKEVECDIIKDSFRYIVVYAKTLKIMIEVIKRLVEQPGTKIEGRPWNLEEPVIKEIISEEIRDLRGKPLSDYRGELEKINENKKEDYLQKLDNAVSLMREEVFNALDSKKDSIIRDIMEQESRSKDNLDEHQTSVIRTLNEKKSELEEKISQQKNIIIDSIKNQEGKSIQELNNLTKKSISELQQEKVTAMGQLDEELQKKVIETSRKLEYLDRREYEIVEKLRTISQFINTHPDLNLSIVEYWKTVLAFTFNLHTEARDTVIPESAKTVWLNGINQTLEALVTANHDRSAERAMREGNKYQRILTTETDCQKIWHRFVDYINNPQREDMEYLRRRVAAYATDQTLKNVAIPSILYREGLSEFDDNYRSIDSRKNESYKEKKSLFRTFFIIVYDEMIERFRGLIMNMVV
jgi:hypothetical protein